ncbi:MAG: hypothetical protein PHS14_15530 [Elusimicrobia bacterium]|nr:hypothetical protein [Elusimicrobiota bacterium]
MTDAIDKIAQELRMFDLTTRAEAVYKGMARRILDLIAPEFRDREKAAWMNHGEWLYHTLATTGRLPSRDESQAEAERRYGEAKA